MEDIREVQIERQSERVPQGRVKRWFVIAVAIFWYATDCLMDATEDNWRIIRRESDLFLGTALTLLGIFSFHSGKYCDGNTADYLSCTRPTTFYYYGWIETILIIIGVTLILLWFFKPRKNNWQKIGLL